MTSLIRVFFGLSEARMQSPFGHEGLFGFRVASRKCHEDRADPQKIASDRSLEIFLLVVA